MKVKNIFLIALIFLFFFFIFSYKLFSSFNFHPDFARDIVDMLKIAQGKPTLIGPKTSFGGFYNGPYYYYLFLPIFLVSNLNIYSLLLFNALIFVLGLLFFWYMITKYYGLAKGVLATLVVGFLPLYVVSSRGPWNGSTYFPFLLAFLTLIYFYNFGKNKVVFPLFGFFAGVIVLIHTSVLSVVFFITGYLFLFSKKKIDIIYFLIGFGLAFAPLILFEFKHDFVMSKNTFVNQSFKSFVENNNVPNVISGEKNFFENLIFIANQLSSQLSVPFLFYIGVFIFMLKKGSLKKNTFFIYSCLGLFITLSIILRFQYASHYLYPVSVFMVFTLVITLLRSKLSFVLFIVLFIELFSFPFYMYHPSVRRAETYESAVDYVIRNKIIDKNTSFNIFQVLKDNTSFVPVGNEYRFFFRKNGYIPKSEFEYSRSQTLLVFSEMEALDITRLDTWEINEFGKKYLRKSKSYKIGGMAIYKIEKL